MKIVFSSPKNAKKAKRINDEELTDREIKQIELGKEEIARGEGVDLEEVKKMFKLSL